MKHAYKSREYDEHCMTKRHLGNVDMRKAALLLETETHPVYQNTSITSYFSVKQSKKKHKKKKSPPPVPESAATAVDLTCDEAPQ